MLPWLIKKASGATDMLSNCKAVKKESDKEGVAVVYFGDLQDSLFHNVHIPAALSEDRIRFYHTTDSKCA